MQLGEAVSHHLRAVFASNSNLHSEYKVCGGDVPFSGTLGSSVARDETSHNLLKNNNNVATYVQTVELSCRTCYPRQVR